MKFENNDLLNYEELEQLIDTSSPDTQAEIIGKKLKTYLLLTEDERLYVFDSENVLYNEKEFKVEEEILITTTNYITKSQLNLNNQEQQLIKLKYKKLFDILCKNTTVSKYIPQLKRELRKKAPFKADYFEIHYLNGFIDLKTKEFKKREVNKHYVCNYIERNYKPSTEKQMCKLYKILKQIYPIEIDLKTILFTLGSAITGKAVKLQKILFLLGKGSTGKSTILILCEKALGCYFETMEAEALSLNNKNADKTKSQFADKQCCRMIWTNEPSETKMDSSFFKQLAEGEFKAKLLWKNGTHKMKHNGLPIFTANNLPNIKMDEGVKRRVIGYYHKSKFTTKKTEVNEEKNVYLVKPDLIEELEKEGYLDVWIDILTEYAYKWYNGEEIPIPESFKQATEEIIDTNDIIKDFIDGCLVKTKGGRKDRIGKNDMEKLYKEFYPKRGISVATLIARLRDYDIEYEKGLQAGNGVRGCFIGIKEKDSFDDNDEEYEPIKQLYPKLALQEDNNDEIEKLQNRILELEEMVMINKKQKMEENKKVMKPDIEKEQLKEENKKVNECFMDAMDENKKLRDLLRKNNIPYCVEDIKLNDIFDNIEETFEEDEEDEKENNSNDDFEEMKRKTLEENKKLREKVKVNKDEVIKGDKQKKKKKYKNSVDEIFESKNIKEMDEIDF